MLPWSFEEAKPYNRHFEIHHFGTDISFPLKSVPDNGTDLEQHKLQKVVD